MCRHLTKSRRPMLNNCNCYRFHAMSPQRNESLDLSVPGNEKKNLLTIAVNPFNVIAGETLDLYALPQNLMRGCKGTKRAPQQPERGWCVECGGRGDALVKLW